MRTRDLRLIPVAAGVWAAAGMSLLLHDMALWLAAGLWALVVIVMLGALSARRGARLLALACVAAALAATVVSHTAIVQPARHEASTLATGGGRAIAVTVVVTGKPTPTSSGRLRFDAHASAVTMGADRHPIDSPVVVLATLPAPAGLEVGSVVVAAGTAFRADVTDRAVLVVEATRGLDVRAPPAGVLHLAATLRAGLGRAVVGLPEPGAGLVPGLAVGDSAGVSPELDAAMKQSSLSHLTAVSGANCAIVVGVAFGLTALCGARRGVRIGASLAVLAGFVVLVTPEPSVVRAAVMAAIAMLGVALGRVGAGVSLLCVAVTCALIADPWLAASLGFALSVSATASLLVLARPIAAGMQRWMPRAVALPLSVPIAAQIACGPLLILVDPSVPLYGVVANLLAGPAAPLATIAGLAACLTICVPWLQAGLAAIAWLPAAWIAATAHVLAALPGSALGWLDGVPGAVLLAVVGGAIAVLFVGGAGRTSRFARLGAASVVALVVGVAAGIGALGTVAGPLTVPAGWTMLACDVGQGDAVLVRSAGRVALIDTGPEPEPLRACLARLGVLHLDLLVLTHFDLDHVGGVAAAAGMASTVLHGPPADTADRGILKRLEDAGANTVAASEGLRGTLGNAQWRVVWPPKRSAAFPSGNDASVVLEVRGDVPAMVLLGDLGASSQRALAASGALRPPYPVVKVAHHGSADQDAALYSSLRPAVAVVSAGKDNDYGHPREAALEMLETAGAVIARTDTEGVVAVVPVAGGVSVWRERAPPDVGPAG